MIYSNLDGLTIMSLDDTQVLAVNLLCQMNNNWHTELFVGNLQL